MTIRTDLAVERFILNKLDSEASGFSKKEEFFGDLKITTMKVLTEDFADKIGKPLGDYITVETTPFSQWILTNHTSIDKLGSLIASLLPKEGSVLVVGLGNTDITPDSIGPKTINKVLATRHISKEVSQSTGLDPLREVSVISPSVLGKTGIETKVFLEGIIHTICPSALVVIDALACRDMKRLGSTIQICNTGIRPGAGVGNFRQELTESTLGIPVIALGVPTVIDALTLAMDVLGKEDDADLSLSDTSAMDTMMITPKEIDLVVERACSILSLSINKALQPHIDSQDMSFLLS